MRKNELLLLAVWVADPGSADVERIKEAWTSVLTGPDSDEIVRRFIRLQDAPVKLELGLTVAQLVMLLRCLHEDEVFGTMRVATLLRFFSKHFRTRKQEQLSYVEIPRALTTSFQECNKSIP